MMSRRTFFCLPIGRTNQAGSTGAGAGSPSPRMRGGSRSFAKGNNEFALALYARLSQQPGNLVFSPCGIWAALGMACAGARGDTAAQMLKALRLPPDADAAHMAFADILRRFTELEGKGNELVLATSLWAQDGTAVRAEFIDLIAHQYGGTMNLVDFVHAADIARERINKWIEDATRRRVRNVLAGGSLDASTRLVLASAVYFKGKWKSPFDHADTRDARFHTSDGSKVEVPLVRRFGKFPYVRGEGYQALEMDYLGADLSMVILLPDRADGLPDLEQALSAPMLDDCIARMRSMQGVLSLPRFKIASNTMDVASQLQELGLTDAFDPARADFGGINEQRPPYGPALFLARILQKCMLEVDEKGSAAASASIAQLTLGMLFRFQADHPFLFAIRDRGTGTILFLGRLVQPSPNT